MSQSQSEGTLQGFQKVYLRGKAHTLDPVVQVGDAGITEGVVKAVNQALLDHELIKVRLRQPPDKKAMARDLASRTQSELCGLVGHTVVLYKKHPEKPQIHVPERKDSV